MEFETAKEAAKRLCVTVRAVQKWAKQGKLKGAVMHGRAYMIPKGALPENDGMNATQSGVKTDINMPLPLLKGSFESGEIQAYINNINDIDAKNVALAEYYYYMGDAEKTLEILEPYIASNDASLRYSAGIMCTFANIFKGHIHIANYVSDLVTKDLLKGLKTESPHEVHALGILTAYIGSVILQLQMPTVPKLEEHLKYLPNGIRLYACYVLAYDAYKRKEYDRAVGISETALAMCNNLYPIPAIYVHIIAAGSYVCLKKTDEAKQHFMQAWEIAYPDKLIKLFGVHYRLLQGLVEVCIKDDYPQEYKKILVVVKEFNAGWNKLHVPDEDNLLHLLSPLEVTIVTLYNRGWQKKEIAAHLNISLAKVKKHIEAVYEMLNIQNKNLLKEYLSK